MKIMKEQYSENTVAIKQADDGTILVAKYATIAGLLFSTLSQTGRVVTEWEPVPFDNGTGYQIKVLGTKDMREVLPYLTGYNIIQG